MELFKPVKSSCGEYRTEDWTEEVLDKSLLTKKGVRNDFAPMFEEDNPSKSFAAMKKISDSYEPVAVELENNDLDSFLKSISKEKFKEKREKFLSEEHSDWESSSSSEPEEEEKLIDGESGVSIVFESYATQKIITLDLKTITILLTKY